MKQIVKSTSATSVAHAARLLVSASGLVLSAQLAANDLIFTTSEARPETGRRIDQRSGLTQIALTGGGTISIVDAAEYRLNPDGSVDLYEGSVTVAGAEGREVVVRMPEGLEGRVAGAGSAGNFSARKDGEASGHALTGAVRIGRGGTFDRFAAGELWRVRGQGGARRVIANAAQVQPDGASTRSVVAIGGDAGPVAAALNGIPAGFGDQLAGAGASSDIVLAARRIEAAVGNPALETFPSGDLALLVAAAARLETSFGGRSFPEAQADIIRAYLRFLAGGGAGSGFIAAYSRFVTDYLELIRAGGLPSGFVGTNPADVDAYLAYIRRTGALASLAARDRVLAEAYLTFLASGAGRDGFAASFTNLTTAYFAFVRGGGDPLAFAGASEAALAQTIAFLRDSGLVVQLAAADRALVDAYLANGGLAFAAQYRSALGDYFAFLASGRRPSEYAALDQATVRAYLETLESTGLLQSVLGEQAAFYADYLAFLRSGGGVDAFAGLPANIFAGYAIDLAAFFEFLELGGVPSAYTLLSPETIRAYIAALEAAGATSRFLGDLTVFFRSYTEFLASGGNPDLFAGLPVPPDFPAFAAALNAYAAFLQAGGLPSGYSAEDLAQLQTFLEALVRSGQLSALLGTNADLLSGYFTFLAGGGSPDGFVGLPLYADYISALNAYFAFLQAGGLPSAYTLLDAATIEAYLVALGRLQGGLGAIGQLDRFFVNYFAFITGGGDPDLFAGLPINGGGTPGTPTMLAGYTGGFDAIAPRIDIILGGDLNGLPFVGSESGFGASAYTLNANGGLASYTRDPGGQVRNRGAAQQTDILGNANALIGRWTNGTISIPNSFTFNENQGLHYVLTRPVGPNFIPSLTGRVDYYLIGATRPTIANGSFAPGTFEAGLAIALGGDYRLAMEGTITMPNAANPYVFTFATAGGLADPSQSESTIGFNTNGGFFTSIPGQDNAGNCTSPGLCAFNLRGTFAGSESTIGMAYEARSSTSATAIVGTAIFEAGPQRTFGGNGGGDTPPPPPPPPPPILMADGVVPTGPAGAYLAYAGVGGERLGTVSSVTVIDGKYANNSEQAGSMKLNVFPNASSISETGGDQGVIGWQRDENALVEYRNNNNQNAVARQAANQSWHTIWGSPITNLPTSGVVSFSLIGATQATQTNGQGGLGTFDGRLAVDFGTMRVGLDATVDFGGTLYAFATNGGVANPTLGLDSMFGGRRFDATLATTANGATVTGGTAVQGFLAGDGASHAGLTYSIRQSTTNSIQGAAAFASGAGPAAALAAAPMAASASPGTDWSRWSSGVGPVSSASQVAEIVPASSSAFPAMISEGDHGTITRQAEAMLGGLVTFSGTGPGQR